MGVLFLNISVLLRGISREKKSHACAGWKTFPQPGAYVLKSVRAPLAGGMDMSIFDKLYDKALDEPEGSVKRNVAVALSGFADWFGATVDEIRGHRKGLGHGPDSDPRAEPADYKLYAAGTITADMKEYLLARMAGRRNLAALSYLINADYAVRLGNMAAEYIRKKRKGEDAHLGDLPAVGLVGTVRALAGKLRGRKATAASSGADDDEPEFSILPAEGPLGLEEGPLHDYRVNPDGTNSEITLTETSEEERDAAEDAEVQRLLERVLDEEIPFEGSGEEKPIESQFYSLTMPVGWDYFVEDGTLFLFTAENTYAAVFAVGLSPEEKAQVSIEGFLGEDSVPAGEGTKDTLAPLSREKTLLAGYEAARIDLAGTVDGKPVRTVQWYAIAGDIMYALTLSTREHLYEKYAPAFDSIVASFAPIVRPEIEELFTAEEGGQAAAAASPDVPAENEDGNDLFPGEDAPSRTPAPPPEGDDGDDLF